MTTNERPTFSTAIALLAYERTLDRLANPEPQDETEDCGCTPRQAVERLRESVLSPHGDDSPCFAPVPELAGCLIFEIIEGIDAALDRTDADLAPRRTDYTKLAKQLKEIQDRNPNDIFTPAERMAEIAETERLHDQNRDPTEPPVDFRAWYEHLAQREKPSMPNILGDDIAGPEANE